MKLDRGASRFAPGPVDDAPLGVLPPFLRSRLFVLPRMLRDPLGSLRSYADRYGGIVALSPGRYFLVAAPEMVKHVLQDNHANYIKGPGYRFLNPVIGASLLNTDGKLWLRQRRIVQPVFYRKHYPAVNRAINQETALLFDRWEDAARRGEPVFVRHDMVRLTLTILLRGFFGSGLEGREEAIAQAILTAKEHINLISAANPLRLPLWLPTPANVRFHRAVRTLDAFVYEIIERRRTGALGDDLVSILVAERDEDSGLGLDDRQIRDVLVGLISAAHETASDSLFWTWYLLSQSPVAQQRVEEEVDRVLGGRVPELEDLTTLTYLGCVVHESMRIYPPGWMFARQAVADDTVGGYAVPAGSTVVLSPYVTHNLEEFWPRPGMFDPERFLPGRDRARPKYAYFPFGGGPRQCVGTTLAMLELPVITAMAAQRFRLEAQELNVKPYPHVSLQPDRKVLFRVHLRGRGAPQRIE